MDTTIQPLNNLGQDCTLQTDGEEWVSFSPLSEKCFLDLLCSLERNKITHWYHRDEKNIEVMLKHWHEG